MEIATYKYQRITGVYPLKKFEWYEMKVEILDDTGKRLRIKFLGYHADGRVPGSMALVNHKSVKRSQIIDSASRSGKSADIATYLENLDSKEIRKPYKDD